MESKEIKIYHKQTIYDISINFLIGLVFIIISVVGALKNKVFDILYFLKILFRFCNNIKHVRVDALSDSLELLQMVSIDFILILLLICGIGMILGNLVSLEETLTNKEYKECLLYKVYIVYMFIFSFSFYIPGVVLLVFFVVSTLLGIGFFIIIFSGILMDILSVLNIHIIVIKVSNYVLSLFTGYSIEAANTLANSETYVFITINLLIFTYMGYPLIKRTFDFMIWIIEKTNKRSLDKIKTNWIYKNFINLFSINKLRVIVYTSSFIVYIMCNSYSFKICEIILNKKIIISEYSTMISPQYIIKEALLTYIIADAALYIIYDFINKKKENKIQIKILRMKINYQIIKKIKLFGDFDNMNNAINEEYNVERSPIKNKNIIIDMFERLINNLNNKFVKKENFEIREKNKIKYIKSELLKIDTNTMYSKKNKIKDERINKIIEIDNLFNELNKYNTYSEIMYQIDKIILFVENAELL
ncbi:MAG: hypothetical protein ACERLG_02785 [Sedimentibacter sp.]